MEQIGITSAEIANGADVVLPIDLSRHSEFVITADAMPAGITIDLSYQDDGGNELGTVIALDLVATGPPVLDTGLSSNHLQSITTKLVVTVANASGGPLSPRIVVFGISR
ncbi:hypothetical protein LCGC14_0726890 [marine sediment metagenome]|uniref:Uncharacterized protein n=1 Tax=marine sediment metagenome TaxID=412755 RepID=A0A0F9QAS9_9ZZZZ